MTQPRTTVESTVRELTSIMPAVPWALVGGLAVSARTQPRFTRDVDLAVAVDGDQQAEQIVHELATRGWSAYAVVEQESTGRLAQVRLRSSTTGSVTCDLLFASSGIEREVAAGADRMEVVEALALPVASTGHLIALKLLAVSELRQQDRLDLAELAGVAQDRDWSSAADAVRLIETRGFARGRDLTASLEELRGL